MQTDSLATRLKAIIPPALDIPSRRSSAVRSLSSAEISPPPESQEFLNKWTIDTKIIEYLDDFSQMASKNGYFVFYELTEIRKIIGKAYQAKERTIKTLAVLEDFITAAKDVWREKKHLLNCTGCKHHKNSDVTYNRELVDDLLQSTGLNLTEIQSIHPHDLSPTKLRRVKRLIDKEEFLKIQNSPTKIEPMGKTFSPEWTAKVKAALRNQNTENGGGPIINPIHWELASPTKLSPSQRKSPLKKKAGNISVYEMEPNSNLPQNFSKSPSRGLLS
jgi:hypothetical protein